MLRPWEDPVEDPPDLPANDLSFTAWIEASCKRDLLHTVYLDFEWLSAEGKLSEYIDAGSLASWIAPDAEAEEGDDAEKAAVEVRFERASPPLSGSCSFVRQLADLSLKVRIHHKPLTAEETRPAEKAPEPKGAKGKAKVPDVPAPRDHSDDVSFHDVLVPLAPLILPGRRQRGADPGAFELLAPEVSEEGPAVALNEALQSIKVGVRCDSQVMSEEVSAHLNPLLVTINSVHRLPQEEHVGQTRDRVMAVLSAFGQRQASGPCALSSRGSGRLNFHRVFFAGTWDQRSLREVLQTERFHIEVHDRDHPQGAGESRAASAEKGEKQKEAKQAEDPKQGEESQLPLATESHGVAHFALGELASERPPCALELRLGLEPSCKRRRRLGASPSTELQVASLFGERGPELLASVRDVQHEHTPGYLDCGSFVRLTARTARPLPTPLQASAMAAEKKAAERKAAAAAAAEREAAMAAELEAASAAASKQLSAKKGSKTGSRPASAKAKAKSGSRPVSGGKGVKSDSRPSTAVKEEAKPEAAAGAEAGEEAKQDDRPQADGRQQRGGFFRVVLVVDNSKLARLKRLLRLIAEHNIATLRLDPERMADYRTLAAVELSEEQRSDLELDVLTGFIVMDRNMRIVVVEGVRDGPGMGKVMEVLGVGKQRDAKFKVLANSELSWSLRLYGEFGLCLKQIKLRQSTLAAVTQRPDVCLGGRAEPEATAALHGFVAMKHAERLQALTKADSFPRANALLTVEIQYGQFVTREDRDCETSRHRERDSSESAVMANALEALGSATATIKGTATVKIEEVTKLVEEGGASASNVGPGEAQTIRVKTKPSVSSRNEAFEASLSARSAQPAPDIREANKAILRELSSENAKANSSLRNVGPRKVVDTSFLDVEAEVHIYSGQKLNSAELQKRALRASMEGQEGKKLWTYSVERNSGCFPMIEKEVSLDKMLRQSTYVEDSREPFRYPKQRQKEDFKRPVFDVSEARKEDLASPWVENQLYPELEAKEIIRGAFDSRTLGTGGAHVIPARRPGLHPPGERTPEPEREPLQPPMRIGGKASMCLENFGDKYHKSILEGEPKTKSLRFEDRSVPRSVTRKFGLGTAPKNVEVPPLSLNLDEPYDIVAGNSDCLTNFMRNVARPVAVPREPSADATARAGGGRAAAAAALSAREPRPPQSARERSSGRSFLARFSGTQAWSHRVGAGAAGATQVAAAPVSAR